MKSSLRVKLSLSYALVAAVSVLVVSLMTNMFLEKQFKVYTILNQKHKNEEVVDLISKQYNGVGQWNYGTIENLGVNGIAQGIIIKVKDSSGKVIWDAATHNNGLCKQMIDHIEQNMTKYYGSAAGKYEEKSYPIYNKSQKIGTVEIGYYGPFYYSDEDISFINNLNELNLGIGIVVLLFAIIIGIIMARRISTPISRVVKSTENIAKGNFDTRIIEISETKEIDLLTSAVNNLADTLQSQENLRKRMTADVAHELRTPLATLQSHMEAMIDGIWEPNSERLKSCHEEIIRLNKLVGNLGNLAKYESEAHKLYKIKYDISEQIRKIIYNFEAEYKNKNVNISFIGKSEIIIADRDKISQVIINLISNALKYTPSGGNAEVTVRGTEKEIYISVRDTGIGISEEDLPYVFERFYRADKSRNKETGGTGVGLSIAKAIVNMHKGSLKVQSTLGKGAEFTVLLPRTDNIR